MDEMIPLMSEANEKGNRRNLGPVSLLHCLKHPHLYDLVKNKRGKVRRALLKPTQMTVRLSNAGQSFLEPLPNVGKSVWSLRLDKKDTRSDI